MVKTRKLNLHRNRRESEGHAKEVIDTLPPQLLNDNIFASFDSQPFTDTQSQSTQEHTLIKPSSKSERNRAETEERNRREKESEEKMGNAGRESRRSKRRPRQQEHEQVKREKEQKKREKKDRKAEKERKKVEKWKLRRWAKIERDAALLDDGAETTGRSQATALKRESEQNTEHDSKSTALDLEQDHIAETSITDKRPSKRKLEDNDITQHTVQPIELKSSKRKRAFQDEDIFTTSPRPKKRKRDLVNEKVVKAEVKGQKSREKERKRQVAMERSAKTIEKIERKERKRARRERAIAERDEETAGRRDIVEHGGKNEVDDTGGCDDGKGEAKEPEKTLRIEITEVNGEFVVKPNMVPNLVSFAISPIYIES